MLTSGQAIKGLGLMDCVETVYLVRKGGLHKIGITSDFDRRVKELAPDHVQARLNLEGDENFTAADVERMLHARFKPLRLPQTEYFRLTNEDVLECCEIMKSISDQKLEPLEYSTTEVALTPEQEETLADIGQRVDVLAAEMDKAVEAGSEHWIDDVQARVEIVRDQLNRFKDPLQRLEDPFDFD